MHIAFIFRFFLPDFFLVHKRANSVNLASPENIFAIFNPIFTLNIFEIADLT